jgi:20S proteasome alpha/beta subunit
MLNKDFQKDPWRKLRQEKRREKVPVTVCIAAMCGGGAIFGIADLMKTAGDFSYEPDLSKIFQITETTIGLTAGDSGLAFDILRETYDRFNSDKIANPELVWTVKQVADTVGSIFRSKFQETVQNQILFKFGVDYSSLANINSESNSQLVRHLVSAINDLEQELPPVHIIVAGYQHKPVFRSHIYVVENGIVTGKDQQGFAAVGSGATQATYQLLKRGFTRSLGISETAFLVYYAKKCAEVTPYVGKKTHLCVVNPWSSNGRNMILVAPEVTDVIDTVYAKFQENERTNWDAVNKTMVAISLPSEDNPNPANPEKSS